MIFFSTKQLQIIQKKRRNVETKKVKFESDFIGTETTNVCIIKFLHGKCSTFTNILKQKKKKTIPDIALITHSLPTVTDYRFVHGPRRKCKKNGKTRMIILLFNHLVIFLTNAHIVDNHQRTPNVLINAAKRLYIS